MLKITKQVLKKLVKFKVTRSMPGRIRLKATGPSNMYNEVELYNDYIKRAIMLLPGIEEVEFNYTIGTALIIYDVEKTYESRIIKWVNKIIDIGLDNSDMITEYSDTNIGYVENVVEQQLREEVKKL